MAWNTRIITKDPTTGKQTDLYSFAERMGKSISTVKNHFYRNGRSLDGFGIRKRAGAKGKFYEFEGAKMRVTEIASKTGAKVSTVRNFISKHGGSAAGFKKPKERVCYAFIDGQPVTLAEFAARFGGTPNAVAQFYRHHGTLDGYVERLPHCGIGRLYTHDLLGMTKTLREWARHFGVQKKSIRMWVKKHGNSINGYETRRKHVKKPVRLPRLRSRKRAA